MKKIITLLFLGFIILACNNREKIFKKLKEKREAYWKKAYKRDINSARELDKAYNEFYLQYPSDSALPGLYYENADLLINGLDEPENGCKLLEKLYATYPDYKKSCDALYLHAFVLETKLNDHSKAKEKYKMLVAKYPTGRQAKETLKVLYWWDRGGTDAMVKHMMDSLEKAPK